MTWSDGRDYGVSGTPGFFVGNDRDRIRGTKRCTTI